MLCWLRTSRCNKRIAAAAVFFSTAILGCVSVPEKPAFDASKLIWPPPPQPARIKYVGILKDSTDMGKASGFSAWLLGEEKKTMEIPFPRAVAVDVEGRVYVTYRYGAAVFDLVASELRPFADEPGPGGVRSARGIAVAPDSRIFIADSELKKIMVYTRENNNIMQIGKPGDFENPQGVAIDAGRSRLYVTDAKKHSFRAYDLDGNLIFSVESSKDVPEKEHFWFPVQVTVNSKGLIYLVDQLGTKINIYSPEGKFLRSFGSLGDRMGQFVRPKGIAVDSEDNVYVTDAAFGNFQIFDPEDRLLLIVGSVGSAPGQFNLPAMIHIDRHDRIYITERGNHRIQILQYLGKKYYQEHPEEKPPLPIPASGGKMK